MSWLHFIVRNGFFSIRVSLFVRQFRLKRSHFFVSAAPFPIPPGLVGTAEERREWPRTAHSGKANIFRRPEILRRLPIPQQLATENSGGTKNWWSDVRVPGEVVAQAFPSAMAGVRWDSIKLIFMTIFSLSSFHQISTSPPRFIHYNVRVNGKWTLSCNSFWSIWLLRFH